MTDRILHNLSFFRVAIPMSMHEPSSHSSQVSSSFHFHLCSISIAVLFIFHADIQDPHSTFDSLNTIGQCCTIKLFVPPSLQDCSPPALALLICASQSMVSELGSALGSELGSVSYQPCHQIIIRTVPSFWDERTIFTAIKAVFLSVTGPFHHSQRVSRIASATIC